MWGGGDDSDANENPLGLTGDDTSSSAAPAEEEPDVAAPTEADLGGGDLRVVDPPPGNRTELEGVANVLDDNASTGWSTDTYNAPAFGDLKPGMGILIDLGEEREVASVRVQMTSAGATVGLLAGNEDPGDSSDGDQTLVDSFTTLAEPVEDADTNIELQAGGASTRYVVVWVTHLPPSSGGYKLTISDINVFVR